MLEVQLAEIIRQGFSQCPTVGSQLRLLEVFEGISSRELVQDNLRDKDKMLVQGFTSELSHVKTMFQYLAKSPPLHKNMPAVVSKIQWVHALRQRIQVIFYLIFLSYLQFSLFLLLLFGIVLCPGKMLRE